MIGLLTQYRMVAKDIDQSLKTIAAKPELKREIEYYRSRIGSIKSIDQFMGDQRIYNFAMKAFGLSDMAYAKAYMRKALTEGIDQPQAFSLRLADSRFREFVENFNFVRYGSATTSFDRAQEGTVERYKRVALELEAGETNEGLRLALYFTRTAPKLDTTFGILADKAAYTVVRTALGLPDAISATDIDRQASLISSKLNVEDLKDPEKLKRFIDRFLAQYEVRHGSGGASAIPGFAGAGTGIGMDTLLSLQGLRRN